jgi:hypothetical protein
MSTVIADNLTGKTAANDVTVTVGATATASLQSGLIKGFLQYGMPSLNGTEDLTGVNESFNISSVTDFATGSSKTTVTNAFSSSTYPVTNAQSTAASAWTICMMDNDQGFGLAPKTTTSYYVAYLNQSAGTYQEPLSVHHILAGDLA